MKIKALQLALALALSLGAGLSLSGCQGSDAKATAEEEPGQPVEVVQAKLGPMDLDYLGTATLEADRSAQVMSETGGEVVAIFVEEGDFVREGQVLARVESERARLMLRQQQAMNERLRLDTARNERLAERQLVSRDLLDQTRFQQATQNAAVDLAQLDLSKTDIRAPFSGVITRRLVKPGQWLGMRSAAFELVDFASLKAKVNVPEKQASLIRAGMTGTLNTEVAGSPNVMAVVERISPIVDRTTGTVSATVSVDNAERKLRPGQFVRVAIRHGHLDEALLVPRAAIQSGDGQDHVFLVQGNRVRKQLLSLGWERDGVVQVRDGLKDGDTVVISGQSALSDGSKIERLKS